MDNYMLSRLEKFSKHYKESSFHSIDVSIHPEAKAEFGVFVTPALKVFSHKKELMSKNKFFSIREMKTILDRYHLLIFS
ncbi:hypothetical protein [Cetobacterium sp.]|uniref:hypothetical protein n=1 Tax=Cetobacterium sp. TaxID=2071632 RepID=UPI003F66591F